MSQDIYVVCEHLRSQIADITFIMLAAARELAKTTGGKVIAVLLGNNMSGLAANLAADQVLLGEHPTLEDFTSDAYSRVLAQVIKDQAPRAVFFGHTSIGTDIAGSLSMRLDLPLVTSVREFTDEGDFVSQICGGKIMAEGKLPAPTTLVTLVPGVYKPEQGQSSQPPQFFSVTIPPLEDLRVAVKQYIEPESGDVDIAREPLLIAVGRGIQTGDNIELAEELAQALGGVVCASRPVVDQGWLPTSRLVGKSGKAVKPKVYLALGISGAPEHIEGMKDAPLIVAVNSDPQAPIFNVAHYGIVADAMDMIPSLKETVQALRG